MAITVRQLHPLFCAEIGGVDAGAAMDDATFADIRAAFEEYSVLVLRDQSMDDERQIAFSQRFGPLEMAGKANPAVGTFFARQSNLDIGTGGVIPAGGSPDDLPEGQLSLALGQFVQASSVALLVAVRAGCAARGRQHRIRHDARGI